MKRTDTTFRLTLSALGTVLFLSSSLWAINRLHTLVVSTLSGTAFYDCNGNGTREATEAPFANATVSLTGGSTPLSTTTDANGNYQFANLAAGNYTVTFGFPANATALTFSPKTTGGSQVNASGATDPLSIDGIANVGGINAGIIDRTPPKITWTNAILAGNVSGDTLTMECDNLTRMDATWARAIDNTGERLPVIFYDAARQSGNCARDGFIELLVCRWASQDTCGNAAFIELFVKIVDTKRPTLSNVPRSITVNTTIGETIPSVPTTVTGSDICSGGGLPVVFGSTIVNNACGYDQTRTWTTTDNCGNTASASQTITVITVPNCNGIRVSMDTFALSFVGSGVIDTCLNIGTGRNISNIRRCSTTPRHLATVSSQGSNCIRVEPIPNAVGVDTICAQTCDASGQNCRDMMLVLSFAALRLPPCDILDSNRNIALFTANCNANACYCLANRVDIRILSTDYTITDNGRPYVGGFMGCRFDTLYSYSYFSAPNMGTSGPYRLDFWQLNGVNRTIASFQTVQQLVDSMRVWDPIGNWRIDPIAQSIFGGSSVNRYGGMKITKLSNGAIGLLELNTSLISNGVEMCFNRGQHTVIFRNNTSGCTDTLNLSVLCPSDSSAPIAVDDRVTTLKNRAVDVAVLGNDRLNGILQSINTLAQPRNGRITRNAQNVYTYTPNADFCGDDAFTYSICNNFNFCDTATVSITVSCDSTGGGNRKPLAVDDMAGTQRGRAVTIPVLANDSTNGTLTRGVTLVGTSRNGTVSIQNNQIVYTPNAGFCGGNDTLAYEICNTNGCDTAQVVVAVSCDTTGGGNRRPVAVDDRATTVTATLVTIPVLSNDTLNGTLVGSVRIIRFQNRGSASVQNNQIVYTPILGQCNFNDTLTYEICNANGCDTGEVVITVNCDNNGNTRKPNAIDDLAATVRGRAVTIAVLANDSLFSSLTRPATVVRTPRNGSTSVVNNQIVYTPNVGFCGGNDTLSYEICNINGCDTAQVVVAVSCDTTGNSNRRPVAVDDRATTLINRAVTITVLANDSLNGTLTRPLSIVRFQSRGSSTIVNNQIVYTPIFGQCNFNDTLSYEICNANGCDTAEVVIAVVCDSNTLNRKPVAVDDRANTVLNRLVTIAVLANDSTNGTLTRPVTIIRTPRNGTAGVATNQIAYTPNAGFCGNNDTLSYEICNANGCDTADVIITVSCDTNTVNRKPIAVDDRANTVLNRPVTVTVLSNDILNGVLTRPLSIVRFQSRGVASISNNEIIYTPNAGFCGDSDTLSYEICNANGCDTADVIISVSCDTNTVNRKPVAVDDRANTVLNRLVTIAVLTNDTTNGNLTRPVTIIRTPRNGTAGVVTNQIAYTPNPGFCANNDTLSYEICNANGCDTADVIISVSCDTSTGGSNRPIVAVDDNIRTRKNQTITFRPLNNDTIRLRFLSLGAVRAPRNGNIGFVGTDSLVYEPNRDFCGRDTFEYRICDTALNCDTAFVFVEVTCDTGTTTLKPVAVNDTARTLLNRPVTVSVLANDTLNGVLSRPLSIIGAPRFGSASVNSNNQIVYTPFPSFCGANDTLSYEICNVNGCDTANLVVTVECDSTVRNRLPVAVYDSVTTGKNTLIRITVMRNDTLNGRLDSMKITRSPLFGTAVLNADFTISYTPDSCGFTDSLIYRICNPNGCDTALVVIKVLCSTDSLHRPVAVNDSARTFKNQPFVITVISNDSLFGQNLDTLRIIRGARRGLASVENNQIIYIPQPDSCNYQDTLSYEICTRNGCDTADVLVRVDCVSPFDTLPPVAVFDRASGSRRTPLSITVLLNDSVRGSDTFRVTRAPRNGTARFDSLRRIVYTPDTSKCGNDTLIYEICNRRGCDTAIVYLNILCDSLNVLLPVALNDTTITLINEKVNIDIFRNDTLRGARLVEVVRPATRGIVTVMPDSSAMYTPDREFCGLDSFTYRICNTAGCDTAFVLIRVSCGDTVRVFNGFSPNNDGRNDSFVIRGIENYPDNEVIIWNRWGNEVFRKKAYRNDAGFDGNWDGRILPDGTYFYCILLNDGTSKPITGYLQILR